MPNNTSNTKEEGFETIIVKYLVENNHYEEGLNSDYNKLYAIDEVRLFRFLHDTQEEKVKELRIEESEIEKKKFLDRLSKKISDTGVIEILRKGMKYKNHTLDFYMVRPSEGNLEAKIAYEKNIFSVTRQLRYSEEYGKLALDVCIFLNGLPIITMELKNQLTKQNFEDAIKQFMQVSNTVGWAKDASTLGDLLDEGKKIIITIVHKFQFILDAITDDHKGKNFAIIIDEAHSSQNGSLAAKMNIVISGNTYDDDDSFEDKLNTLIEGKKMAPNASYFAFTATPKNKTLEMFGKKMVDAHGNPIMNEDGTRRFKVKQKEK